VPPHTVNVSSKGPIFCLFSRSQSDCRTESVFSRGQRLPILPRNLRLMSVSGCEHREPEAGLRLLPRGDEAQSGASSRYTGGPQQTPKRAEAPQVTASVTLLRSSRATTWISVRVCNGELIEQFQLPPPVLLPGHPAQEALVDGAVPNWQKQ